MKRREFVRTSLAAGLTAAMPPLLGACSREEPSPDPFPKPLKLLILGGSGFIGPHMVEAALDRGHEVTIFNRGKTNPHLFPEIEKLIGDRDGNLKALENRSWDVVIDNSGYVPRHVRDSAQLLADAAEHYLFTSTGGVYAAVFDGNWPDGYTDEDAPLAPLPEPESEEVNKYYGQLKGVCETEVRTAFPGRYTVTRPGLIVGPGDTTDRFTYYPARMARGGEMIAFGAPEDNVQWIDARDLAKFCLHCIENRIVNTFNVIVPRNAFTMGEMYSGIQEGIGSTTDFTWVAADFLEAHGVVPGSLMPWIPPQSPWGGLTRLSPARAFENGLTHRPLAETARDTFEWWLAQSAGRRAAMAGGLRGGDLAFGPASMERQLELEAKILSAWQSRVAPSGAPDGKTGARADSLPGGRSTAAKVKLSAAPGQPIGLAC